MFRSRSYPDKVTVEIHSVRTAVRRNQRGASLTDLVVEITQRRRGYFDANRQRRIDACEEEIPAEQDFIYRAGCTLLINPLTMEIRRVIRTPGTINDDVELERMRSYLVEGASVAVNAFQMKGWLDRKAEPFAMLHAEAEV